MTPEEDKYDHLRWYNETRDKKLSWKETLIAMCKYYGTFCGRWHSNEFWKQTLDKVLSMSEEQCKEKVIQIEREADGAEMKRLIINFNPQEKDMETALIRSMNALREYRRTRDGERITITFGSVGAMWISHDKDYADLAVFSPQERRNDRS